MNFPNFNIVKIKFSEFFNLFNLNNFLFLCSKAFISMTRNNQNYWNSIKLPFNKEKTTLFITLISSTVDNFLFLFTSTNRLPLPIDFLVPFSSIYFLPLFSQSLVQHHFPEITSYPNRSGLLPAAVKLIFYSRGDKRTRKWTSSLSTSTFYSLKRNLHHHHQNKDISVKLKEPLYDSLPFYDEVLGERRRHRSSKEFCAMSKRRRNNSPSGSR